MELQNVVVDFEDVKVKCRLENKTHYIDSIYNMSSLSIALDDAFQEPIKNIVVQYTKDQYGGSEPRILVNDSTTDKTLSDIESDYSVLSGELDTMKLAIENKIPA